jgi:hypothetical protein
MVSEVVAPAKAVNVAPEFMLVANVGDVENTKFVLVVPVAPAAV